MSAHTKGPWTFGLRVITADTADTFNVCVALVSSARESPEISENERKSNGRLIAASPDMFDLLTSISDPVALACLDEYDPNLSKRVVKILASLGGK